MWIRILNHETVAVETVNFDYVVSYEEIDGVTHITFADDSLKVVSISAKALDETLSAKTP